MNQYGDDLVAWCARCRRYATRQGVYDQSGSLVDERDPICGGCLFTAELISEADLHKRGVQEQAEANARALAALSPKGERKVQKAATANSVHVSKRAAARMLGIGRSGDDNTLTLLIRSGRLVPVSFLGKQRFQREDVLKIAREGLPTVEELRALASSRATPATPRKTRKRRSDADVVQRLESWRPPERS